MAEDDARLRNRQGVLHAQRGDLLTAIRSFERARLADPLDDTALTNLSCAHNNMGVLLCRDRRFTEAIAHFEKAKQHKPEDLQIRFNLLSALVLIRDAERVDIEARGILALRPRDPETINKVANAFLKIEDDDSARNLLERIL
ncbi:MAG TPA: tetratricopeptide repeat protein, partial [Candidatus Ozemobacteraceae bacterium]|nr:tetratricopeptide repeat protein [Candidatus Ozemobacteraceae bacterium]